MPKILKLIQNDARLLMREPIVLFWAIIFPLFLLLVFGSMVRTYSSPEITINIYNDDSSDQAKALISYLENESAMKVRTVASREAVINSVKKGDAVFGAVIPSGFGQKKSNRSNPEIELYYSEGSGDVNTIGLSILESSLLNEVVDTDALKGKVSLNIEEVTGSSSDRTYIDFLVPGLIALIVLTMSFFSVGMKILSYRESGILKQLRLQPIGFNAVLLSQCIVPFAVVFLQSCLMIYLACTLFGFTVHFNPLIFFVYVLLGYLSHISLSLFLISVVKTVNAGAALINLASYVMMFMGGVYFPDSIMPKALLFISYAFPIRYLLEGMRELTKANPDSGIVLLGAGIQILVIAILMPIVNVKFKKQVA